MKTEHEIETEQSQLAACHQEVERWKEQYMRLNADIENMKRRAYKDQEVTLSRMMSQFFSSFLTVLDNFDRAIEAATVQEQTTPLYNGLTIIRKELMTTLERYGVREMTEIKTFDPELHEALSHVPADDKHADGDIVTVLQKGYWYNDHVLRHAKVTVATK